MKPIYFRPFKQGQQNSIYNIVGAHLVGFWCFFVSTFHSRVGRMEFPMPNQFLQQQLDIYIKPQRGNLKPEISVVFHPLPCEFVDLQIFPQCFVCVTFFSRRQKGGLLGSIDFRVQETIQDFQGTKMLIFQKLTPKLEDHLLLDELPVPV